MRQLDGHIALNEVSFVLARVSTPPPVKSRVYQSGKSFLFLSITELTTQSQIWQNKKNVICKLQKLTITSFER